MPEIVVADGPKEVAQEVAKRIARDIERAVEEREWCWLALSGGHFAAPIYDVLAHFSVPWSHVEFFFTDERCVPPSHPASSYGEAVDRLFTNPRIGDHQVHRIEAELPDREEVVERYEQELPDDFDVVLLEMGTDGHVAGLFPGSAAFDAPAADDEPRRVLAVEVAQKPRWRITLAPAALTAAEHVYVVACGRERAAMVRRALRDDDVEPREVPARVVRDATWVLDRAAAAMLD